jgi:hypothetical protein
MQQRLSEIEKLFLEEVREKKKIAQNVHHKTGKRGYVGKMMFPTDYMSRKEKYNHRKAGKVMTSNIYDEILTIGEFELLENHEKKNRLQYWRTKYSNQEIKTRMGIHNTKYYGLVADLNLPKAARTNGARKAIAKVGAAKSVAKREEKQIELEIEEIPTPTPIPTPIPTSVQEIMVDGLHVIFNGTYSAEKIEKQLTKFMLLLDAEEDEFYIELKLVQKQQKEKKEIL